MSKAMASLYVRTTKAMEGLQDRREQGQGALEYVGMVAAAALVVITVIGFTKSWNFTDLLTTAVDKIKSAAGF